MPANADEASMWVITNFQYAALFLLTVGPLALLCVALGSRFGALVGYVVPVTLCLYGLYGVGYLGMMIRLQGGKLLEWVYIISPKDGKKVGKKVLVRFGLKGMGVAPAGVYLGADKPSGHHHLVIDSELPNLKLPFPMDEKNLHFGGGQTEVTLELEPGEHTLQLVLGDHSHIPHDPPLVSKKITITVE